ncbi:MAG: trypsin-like peptidase domain-containing protein, partial [Actinobacteria bacterium]|nr:trypsin-like peptidase domain-containing protein [Actinomycetota bacterium]
RQAAGVGASVALGSQRTIVETFFPNKSLLARPQDVQAVLSKVLPAVVSINTTGFKDPTEGGAIVAGAGTGMILTPNGEVLTNNHVVAGASTVTVTLYGQTLARPADVIGTDPSQDVALVQILGVTNLPTVQLGNSSSALVGDSVLAIGNALALAGGPTVTEGIVSAENRSLTAEEPLTGGTEHLTGLIQTDAAINPGNSGGPLVNSAGQVIAMNTAVASSSAGNAPAQDIGFAIAINTIKPLIAQLRSGGVHGPRVAPGQTPPSSEAGPLPGSAFIGVEVETVTAQIAREDNLSISSGALVVGVLAGSPAAAAGIQTNEVIVGVGTTPVTSDTTLAAALKSYKPGEQASLSIVRGTQHLSITVVLGSAP